ncbi:DNA phosphorothioation-dependent restriction protein DptF [Clostridium sp. NSJ-6]|uniref:DNA phosphorothioation-dependent restriction protein DptF n=1 Tax=Clostridium hominis TaxID=2763036 RepID=A0ABR7DDN6_9CLOT|nr:DNA phosphorothioation-dependent restriction protein DptF [Clostridium hominis]MBC5629473.1 DNA phosphorothioation-dependent restriction protein DptF [Clostridium hominis]
MERDIFKYFDKDYKELYSLGEDINRLVFTAPHSVILKSRVFIEILSKEIAKLEDMDELNSLNLAERLSRLKFEDIFNKEINEYLFQIRITANKAAHEEIEEELEIALSIHRYIFKITCWFIETYIDFNFKAPIYKNPLPNKEKEEDKLETNFLQKLMGKVDDLIKSTNHTKEVVTEVAISRNDDTIDISKETINEIIDKKLEVKSINNIGDSKVKIVDGPMIEQVSKNCLIQELSRLKESSKEAVEGLNTFSGFKRYMHIERDVQRELEKLIKKSAESGKGKLILVCGSVGDGKSHIISYFKNTMPEIMKNFDLHNDATESLEPDKTSMDTLNEVLDQFSDEKIENTTQKFILAINLGTLNNFIDSKYGDRFTKLREFVYDKKILEPGIEENEYNDDSNFQFVDFTDYHLYTLKDGKVKSDYIKELLEKITNKSEYNVFYKSYKANCIDCKNCSCCPIKANYEFISEDEVQEEIIQLLVKAIVKNKILISTRALLNFIYEAIISRTYLDVNSPSFKNKINSMNKLDYVRSLTPNILFNHKELSFIFESLSGLDPLNVRNSKLDDFIIKFNNSTEVKGFFNEYLDLPKGYLDNLYDIDFSDTKYNNVKYELLKTFIRSYELCGKGDIFSLCDNIYDNYIENLYYWNKGEKSKLKGLYTTIKDGIVKWNGAADKNYINIFIGKNQVKYKVSEELEIKADVSGLPSNNNVELVKFLKNIKLRYKTEKSDKFYEIEIDYQLYELLYKVVNGYRPNKNDKNHFINFIEFINKLESIGSQDEKLVFTEKNREDNKKYKLEYNDEFEEYRFVEM